MRICVYCSSSSAVGEGFNQAARELGRLMAARGHVLVYGGGNVGLMGEIARAVKSSGGYVLGIIPRRFVEFELAFEEADELIVTESMAERKALMEDHAEAFIALPGGFGTLEELSQVITLKQLDYVHGPIVLLNTEGFYHHLLAHFEELFRLHFAKPQYRQLYYVADRPGEAIDHIEQYGAPLLPQKWF